MTPADLREMMEFVRVKTTELFEAIAARPDAAAVLGWRPGPGRAPIAWQFMHLGATDDRHLHVRMREGEPKEAEYVRQFAGGSIPDDQTPTVAAIRNYLTSRRQELLDHLSSLSEADLATKPNAKAMWIYREWFKVLIWHEAHHQGQAHLTFNLYRAANDPASPKVGH